MQLPGPAGTVVLHMRHLSVDEAVARSATDRARGLTGAEAERRLRRYGPNVLPRVQRRGALVRLLLQFHNPLIYTLMIAATVTYAVGQPVDASVIVAVVLANAAIGFVQEARSEQALDALARMITVEADVLRDGVTHRLRATALVPGDIVLLSPGDKVSADLRLIEVRNMRVDESALTGESVPVGKDVGVLPEQAVLAERANMAFSGTLVTTGSATGVVVATGAATELGRIHRLLGEASDLATPLTRKLASFSRALTVVIVGLAAVAFAVGTARGEAAPDMLVAAVALAVGAIPEGLPAAVTIALAIGVSRMARRNVIVRRLPAVETLGSTTVICTDKTGTLTQNAMTVQSVLAGGVQYELEGAGYAPEGGIRSEDEAVDAADHPALAVCLTAGMMCGDGDAIARDGGWEPVGDPAEAALVVSARKAGMDRAEALAGLPRTHVVPFESERRFMATVHAGRDGDSVVYVKGAVERVLAMCDRQIEAGGGVAALEREPVLAAAEEMGSRGQRVLALAVGSAAAIDASEPAGLTFAGLQGMSDPPRPEAVAAVRACRDGGIAVKMITGDHAATASAIARRVGLEAPDRVVTGAELAACHDEDLATLAGSASVFARVSAEQKLRLVRALQSRGDVVAMTGDGVNDAPALRQADIGVAMGRSGTEVARESADIVLADDNFASIEAAVEEGRHTFDNLKKFIVWTLPTNMGEGLLILSAVLAGATLPILPVQVLWINMTTAVLLGLMLAFERVEPGVMRRSPRRPSEPLLTRALAMRVLLVSLLLLTASFWLFHHEQARGASEAEARTVAVNVFVAVQLFYLFNCRSLSGPARKLGLFSNRWLLSGVGVTIVLQLLLTYWAPMNDLFRTAPVDAEAWWKVLAAGAVAWTIVEVEKALRRWSVATTHHDTGARPDAAGAARAYGR
jgi:cation-transporting ATPase F